MARDTANCNAVTASSSLQCGPLALWISLCSKTAAKCRNEYLNVLVVAMVGEDGGLPNKCLMVAVVAAIL